ncbi:MAG: HEAT repeat domain-containing protein [Planctomycetes bacterium]|nr:HEAT repeat domain-containing protein [Planctomycetota bacterium]
MRKVLLLGTGAFIIALFALTHWLSAAPGSGIGEPRAQIEIDVSGARKPAVARTNSALPSLDLVQRLKVGDPRLTPLVDSSLPVSQRISPDITAKIPSVSNAEDCKILAMVLTNPLDDDTVRNEISNLLRRSKYPGLTDALFQVLAHPSEKPRFRSFAVQHLWQQWDGADDDARGDIESRLRALIEDRHAEVRREALLALVRMKDPLGRETAVRWLATNGPELDGVRDLAIRCVYDLNLREHLPLIRNHVRNPNETIRIAAIVALSYWKDEESRSAFEEAAESSVVRLQRAGKAAMNRLDGKWGDLESKSGEEAFPQSTPHRE